MSIIPPQSNEIFFNSLMKGLNTAMIEAAEPLIQKALKDIEQQMRKQLASNLIALIHKDFDMQNFNDGLVIHINQEKK